MGKGFGRGAKSVAIVTHAQMRGKAKKVPKGLRGGKRKRIEKRRAAAAHDDDPNAMLETRAPPKERESSTMKALDAQIASVQFKEMVQGRGKLKHLRKTLIEQVKALRRKHHDKRTKINARERKAAAEDHLAATEERAVKRHKITRQRE